MQTNFGFIADQSSFAQLYRFCCDAESMLKGHPDLCVLSARKALESLVRSFYMARYGYVEPESSLFELMQDERFTNYADPTLMRLLHFIRTIGNRGAHGENITAGEANHCVEALQMVVGEFMIFMGVVQDYPAFDASIYDEPQPVVVVPADEPIVTPESVQQYGEHIHDTIHNPLTISEAETRKLYIDLALKEAGWTVSTTDHEIIAGTASIEIEVHGMPHDSGVGYADYVLFDDDGKPLAVVEAKKTSVDPIVGSVQAKLYADCLELKYRVRPVIFYTNGYEYNVIDGSGAPARKVFGFYTKAELHSIMARRSDHSIGNMTVNREISDRYFIQNAATAVCESYNQHHRKALVVMATGTGKTRCAISIVDILQRANVVKRILFLADRRELVTQAKNAFAKFLPDSSLTVLNDKSEATDFNAKVTLSTYQTIINMIDCEDRQFGIAAFDLIVVDECHRSIYNKYRAIFNYFDSLIMGLTATPREQVDASTYDAFDLPDGEPTYSYDLETAINEGFLVNFHAFERTTNILKNGIKYSDLTPEEKKQYETLFAIGGITPEKLENQLFYSQIINTDTIDIVLNCLMNEGLRINGGERLGKTIIFAANHKHAEEIVKRFKVLHPELGDDYCQLIDNKVKFADKIIADFKVPDSQPIIAVSVDMMDTGIDVPEVLNLVFFKRVFSKIKFWQMLGRGTRICKDLNVVTPEKGFFRGAEAAELAEEGVSAFRDKQGFYVFDFCDVFEFFGAHPDGKQPKTTKSITQKIFDCKTEIVRELQAFEHQENPDHKKYYLQYRDELHSKVQHLNRCLVNVRTALKTVDKYSLAETWQNLSLLSVKEIQQIISPLMESEDADEAAVAFDLWLFNMELTEIVGEKDYTKAIGSVVGICNALLNKTTVPTIFARKDKLVSFTLPEYWQNITIEKLEEVRIQVRDLLKFLDKGPVLDAISGFDDKLIEKAGGHVPVAPDFRNYRQKVLDYLMDHNDSPVIEKIKTLTPITQSDIHELEGILFEELGTHDDFIRFAGDMSVSAFVRQLVGLDAQTMMNKLGEWQSKYQFNSIQQEFIHEIVNFVRQNGDIIPSDLMKKSPFKRRSFVDDFKGKQEGLLNIVKLFHAVITPVA